MEAGSIRPGLDVDEVLLSLAGLWEIDPNSKAGHTTSTRLCCSIVINVVIDRFVRAAILHLVQVGESCFRIYLPLPRLALRATSEKGLNRELRRGARGPSNLAHVCTAVLMPHIADSALISPACHAMLI